jgi:hypothetical protein
VIALIILTGLAVGFTGPDGLAWFERRRRAREAPTARVMYLPSARCRGLASGVPSANMPEWHESNDSTSGR